MDLKTGDLTAATVPPHVAPSSRMAKALADHGIWPVPLVVENLRGDAEYGWILDGARVGAPVRTLPKELPPGGISVLVASCFYAHAEGAGARHTAALRNVARRERALFRVLAGDNVYLDVAPDQQGYSDGYEETAARYAHYFMHDAYADALAAVPSCTTWDDHELWNNYPEWQVHLSRTWSEGSYQAYQAAAQEALRLFQMPLNPPPPADGMRCYSFDIAPLRFFVADGRSNRTTVTASNPGLMPLPELNELVAWLTSPSTPGPRVLVIGQPLWSPEVATSMAIRVDHNMPYFRGHYARILEALRASPYDVLVVSGDVHFSRLLKLEFAGDRGVYEFVSSPTSHVLTPMSFSQARTKPTLDGPPGQPPLKPTQWHFASDAPDTFGVLRFKPIGPDVSVSGGFVDGSKPAAPWLPALAPPDKSINHPRRTSVCAADDLFILRQRRP